MDEGHRPHGRRIDTNLFALVTAVCESLSPEERAAGLAVPIVRDLLEKRGRRIGGRSVSPLAGLLRVGPPGGASWRASSGRGPRT
jgi:hypothetical protein